MLLASAVESNNLPVDEWIDEWMIKAITSCEIWSHCLLAIESNEQYDLTTIQ